MIKYNKTLCVLLFTMIAGVIMAQNGVNSPYSRYGFGLLSDQSTSANKGMAGLSYGLRNKYQINVGNPASYSAIDSLTFIFDAGLTLQNANFDNGSVKMNAKNSSLNYLILQFRMFKNIGMTAGFLPYSKINYSFATNETIREDEEGTVYSYESFAGDGGLNQAFLGVGGEVFKGFSIGANVSYLWGDLNHTIQNSYSSSTIWSILRNYTSEIKTYKADLGIQYSKTFNKKHTITLGATYSLGHNVKADAYKIQQSVDESSSSSSVMSQRIDTIANAYQIPHCFGIGFTYVYDNRLTVGVDYTLQKWANVKYPHFSNNTQESEVDYENWKFNNAYKLSLGMEYLPSYTARSIFKRTRYRLGAYYSDPYVKVKGADTREFGVGGAIVMPIFNAHSSKTSFLTISAEYVNVNPKVNNLIKENYLKLGVGLTFSELWFFKWKVQ